MIFLVFDRQIDVNGTTPLYEFGFGLSYTTFTMRRNLSLELTHGKISPLPDHSEGIAPGGLEDLWNIIVKVRVEVTNSGAKAGWSVPQLYVSLPQETTPPGTPIKVLRGFEKVYLEAGQSRRVEFCLIRRDLSYWSVEQGQWVVPAG